MTHSDLDLWRRLRQLAIRVFLGPRAGANPRLRSLLRFLGAKGDQAGQRTEGRLRDYLFVLSVLKDRNLYRRREIAPVRRLHLVVDIRDGDEAGAARLLLAAEYVGGVLLAMPGAKLTLTAWGARAAYPTQSFGGEGQWPILRRLVRAMAAVRPDPAASVGALVRACATDEPAHLVLITPWIEPAFVKGLPAPFGGTCFLVAPAKSLFGGASVGTADPLLSHLPIAAAADRDAAREVELASACQHRRIDLVNVQGGRLLDSLEAAMKSERLR